MILLNGLASSIQSIMGAPTFSTLNGPELAAMHQAGLGNTVARRAPRSSLDFTFTAVDNRYVYDCRRQLRRVRGMKASVSITDAESEVMNILWRTSPIATEDLIAALENPAKWQTSTVKTLITRLLKKGAIRAQKDGRRYLYSPVIKREQ